MRTPNKSPKNCCLLNLKLSPKSRNIPLNEKITAIKKNFEYLSFKKKRAKIITTTGARFDKKVALDTVVSLIDQCQQIKSSAKNIPDIIKTR